MSVINLPNTLTLMRIILLPLFVASMIYRRHDYALYIFSVAAITDTLDGLIARLKGLKTPLGTLLDPLADKFLLVTSFILLAVYNFIPLWLTITVISRDIIIVTGWIVLYLVTHSAKVEPSITGKIAISLQLILIWYILLDENIPAMPDLHGYLINLTALFTILSGLHYIYRGLRESRAY
ncbi:MAG: CDP-alcohol phosphatidyltransferase family protein [Thermodesulfovibrionales bacterium]